MTDQATFRPGERYGERQVAAAEIEAVPNPSTDRDYKIAISYPEFTCLCPRSGFPDFATIRITYVPDAKIVELRALKLYLNRYRNEYVFHEAVVNRILDDLVAAANPRWIRVVGDFNVRGNVKTIVTAAYQQPGYAGPPANLQVDVEG
jgi:7-cyano-7-deazaguanine reductase